jgi:hypothetical protein
MMLRHSLHFATSEAARSDFLILLACDVVISKNNDSAQSIDSLGSNDRLTRVGVFAAAGKGLARSCQGVGKGFASLSKLFELAIYLPRA